MRTRLSGTESDTQEDIVGCDGFMEPHLSCSIHKRIIDRVTHEDWMSSKCCESNQILENHRSYHSINCDWKAEIIKIYILYVDLQLRDRGIPNLLLILIYYS